MAGTNVSADHLHYFIAASYAVFGMVLMEAPMKGEQKDFSATVASHEVNSVVGLAGPLSGYFFLSMDETTAKALASAMMGGMAVEQFDEMASSALAELTNMIAGNSLLQIDREGCDLTPPSVIRGTGIQFSTIDHGASVVPLQLSFGEIVLTVSIHAKETAAA